MCIRDSAVILAYAGFLIPIGILILRMFFEQVPNELTEAGIVDGSSDFQLLTRILLPLAKPAIATCVILLFLDTWNEFIYAMILKVLIEFGLTMEMELLD